MSLTRQLGLFGMLILFVAGCTTPANIAMKKGVSDTIQSSHMVIVSTQNEIKAEVEKSNVAMAMGGGLIPALIDTAVESSRSEEAEATIETVRDVLIDYDFGKEFESALAPKLPSVSWVDIQPVDIIYDKKEDLVKEFLQKEVRDSLMVVNSSYALSHDFTTLKVQSVLTMYSKLRPNKEVQSNEDIDLEELTVYKKTVSHKKPIGAIVAGEGDAIVQWSKDNGALIRNALKESAEDVTNQLIQGLKAPNG